MSVLGDLCSQNRTWVSGCGHPARYKVKQQGRGGIYRRIALAARTIRGRVAHASAFRLYLLWLRQDSKLLRMTGYVGEQQIGEVVRIPRKRSIKFFELFVRFGWNVLGGCTNSVGRGRQSSGKDASDRAFADVGGKGRADYFECLRDEWGRFCAVVVEEILRKPTVVDFGFDCPDTSRTPSAESTEWQNRFCQTVFCRTRIALSGSGSCPSRFVFARSCFKC